MPEKKLTGRIDASRITLMQTPQIESGIVDAFLALEDPVGVTSDVMDALGLPGGVVGTHYLRPTIPGRCVAGPALTVRNLPQRGDYVENARNEVNKMAEFEAHNLASPGDFLVIQGVSNVSNMGGISAQTGKRQGEVGAIVDGGVRDVSHSRAVDYPVWASEFTAVTGKWRIETMEINGSVQIGGVRVDAGDLVIADDTSVCFVPRAMIRKVLEKCQVKADAEARRCAAIDEGREIRDFIGASDAG